MDRVTDSVYITSVLNPCMRVFDVTMHTEYGTSYNSYVVKGAEGIALIDAAHSSFCAYYFDNLDEVLAGAVPDYLVLNHCELDHTGCVAELIARYPGLQVLVSAAGAIYMKNIHNRSDVDVRVVKDGEQLDLGGLTLEFRMAPFLHWPDSMFTWLPEEQVLFSCDFLGAHYCEPQLFDTRVGNRDAYRGAMEYYYECIFGPFKPYVLKGLDKIADLNIKFACNSHGPILSRGCELEYVMDRYREWSTPVMREQPQIPVFYASAYGNTRQLALAVARGIKRELSGASVECYDVIEHERAFLASELNGSDAFVVGSTTINRDAVAPIWHLLADIEAVQIAKRPCAVFGSYGWSGEAAGHLAERLVSLKAKVYDEQLRVVFVPTPDDLAAAEDFGAAFAASMGWGQ